MLKMKMFNAIAFVSLLFSPLAQAVAAEPVLRSGIYIIQMSNSDMTAAATSEAGNSPMILWPYRPTATWAFQHVGNNVYTIRTNSTRGFKFKVQHPVPGCWRPPKKPHRVS